MRVHADGSSGWRWLPLVLLQVALAACGMQGREPLADLVERVSPSVVNISTRYEPEPTLAAFSSDDWQLEEGGQSLGSGFIWSADGYILTNYHVIGGAREIIVRLQDRREYAARLVGHDEPSDLALLQIEAEGLPAVKLAEMERIRPGQTVVAIGSPFGFDSSVTSGILSALGRALDSEQYVPFLQTDAAINPGNSGGPLFNLRGEVIGVNSQIFSQTGGSSGVAFAIPADVADKVARQLRRTGKVARGWLGLVVQPVDRSLAGDLGLERTEGALVVRVLQGGPAAQAGLREGDVILSVNGQTLPSSRELPARIGMLDPGEMVRLELLRQRRRVELRVEVGELSPLAAGTEAVPTPEPDPVPAPVAEPLGVLVAPLTAEQRGSLQMLSGAVRVAEVREGPALRAGIRAEDLLLQLNGQTVDSPERYREVAERLTPGATVPVLVQRRGAPVFLALDVPVRRP